LNVKSGGAQHKDDNVWARMYKADRLHCTYKAVKPKVSITTYRPVKKDPLTSCGPGCIKQKGYIARTNR